MKKLCLIASFLFGFIVFATAQSASTVVVEEVKSEHCAKKCTPEQMAECAKKCTPEQLAACKKKCTAMAATKGNVGEEGATASTEASVVTASSTETVKAKSCSKSKACCSKSKAKAIKAAEKTSAKATKA